MRHNPSAHFEELPAWDYDAFVAAYNEEAARLGGQPYVQKEEPEMIATLYSSGQFGQTIKEFAHTYYHGRQG